MIAKCTVERLIAAMGLAGVRQDKKTITTVGDPDVPCPLNKVNASFASAGPMSCGSLILITSTPRQRSSTWTS